MARTIEIDASDEEPLELVLHGKKITDGAEWRERWELAHAVPQSALLNVVGMVQVVGDKLSFNVTAQRAFIRCLLVTPDDVTRWDALMEDPDRQVPAKMMAKAATQALEELFEIPFGSSSDSPSNSPGAGSSDATAEGS